MKKKKNFVKTPTKKSIGTCTAYLNLTRRYIFSNYVLPSNDTRPQLITSLCLTLDCRNNCLFSQRYIKDNGTYHLTFPYKHFVSEEREVDVWIAPIGTTFDCICIIIVKRYEKNNQYLFLCCTEYLILEIIFMYNGKPWLGLHVGYISQSICWPIIFGITIKTGKRFYKTIICVISN